MADDVDETVTFVAADRAPVRGARDSSRSVWSSNNQCAGARYAAPSRGSPVAKCNISVSVSVQVLTRLLGASSPVIHWVCNAC